MIPAPQDFWLYKIFIFLAITGKVQDADQFLGEYRRVVENVASYLRKQIPVKEQILYRGMLIPPSDVSVSRMAQDYGTGFVSFSADLEAACWFADSQVNLAGVVMEEKPDAEGWIGEYTPKNNEILFHYSWFDFLLGPPGENIYQVALNIISMNGWSQHLIAEFKFHIEHQKEVILKPNITYPLKPIEEYDCPMSQQLDDRYTPRPDWVLAPPGLEGYGIKSGDRIYLSGAHFPIEAERCRQCGRSEVKRIYYLQGLPIRIDSCPRCGEVWSIAESDLRGNPMPELSLNEKQILFTIWWLRRDLGGAYIDDLRQLTSKIMSRHELSRGLRRLQDQGYIDSRNGYILYDAGKQVAWEMVKEAERFGRLPPRLKYSD